ncbi:hypothetical protein [Roseateles sp.]|uniref:hypothetical protein n=1 Tax=Roseateles sp. TaxID=1971397 RepID=UPI003BA55800
MDRLVEQVVTWHNRHPLAKRITIYDVHTIGVVALPFMRNGPAAGVGAGRVPGDARGQIEPVLTDEISPESLAAAWDDESTVAANTNAAHLDALADQEAPPGAHNKGSRWQALLAGLAFWRRGSAASGGKGTQGPQIWPAFSERFVASLSPKAVARFAQQHGYASQPGDATWPLRIVSIDDSLMSPAKASQGGAWPFELYLMSAAIDAGRSRSRVLVGRGTQQPQIMGQRCLSGPRLALLAVVLLSLIGVATVLLVPGVIIKKGEATEKPVEVAAPASAASAGSSLGDPTGLASPAQAASHSAAAAASSPANPASEAQHDSASPAASEATLPTPPPADLASIAAAQKAAIQAEAAAAEAARKAAASADGKAGSNKKSADSELETPAEDAPPRPDIRPQFVKPIPGRSARPLLSAPETEASGNRAGEDLTPSDKKKADDDKTGTNRRVAEREASSNTNKQAADKRVPLTSEPPNSKRSRPDDEPGRSDKPSSLSGSSSSGAGDRLDPRASARAAALATRPVVALVGPVSASKAEAEATLERMRTLVAPTQTGRSPMQAQVFQTPEGYRPALWPFASREEAQLINATLVARGMRTRAVDF